jgi:beta-glucanase (GH16 family)
MATTTLAANGLTATVSGRSVTVSTTITASAATTASLAGICARTSSGAIMDFPLKSAVALSTAGTTLTATATFAIGTYTYWSCAKVGGVWKNLDTHRSFTVSTQTATAPATTAPSGAPMPVGDLTGWKQTFRDDFTTPVAMGGFPGPYSSKWMSYNGFPDSRNKGDYNQKIISMHDGQMDLYLHQVNGRAQVAAPIPMVTGGFGGQKYGKFSVRFKADAVPGYGAAWLLWPDSDIWSEGEIDYPEGGLTGTIWAFNHCLGHPKDNCDYVHTTAAYTSWHTTSVEWKPSGVSFLLDGKVLKTSTSAIPKTAMHWILQTETNANALTGAAGHMLIDWVSIYSYTG